MFVYFLLFYFCFVVFVLICLVLFLLGLKYLYYYFPTHLFKGKKKYYLLFFYLAQKAIRWFILYLFFSGTLTNGFSLKIIMANFQWLDIILLLLYSKIFLCIIIAFVLSRYTKIYQNVTKKKKINKYSISFRGSG